MKGTRGQCRLALGQLLSFPLQTSAWTPEQRVGSTLLTGEGPSHNCDLTWVHLGLRQQGDGGQVWAAALLQEPAWLHRPPRHRGSAPTGCRLQLFVYLHTKPLNTP